MPLIVVCIVALLVLGDSILVVLSSIRSMRRLNRDRANWQAKRKVEGKSSTDFRFFTLVPCFEEATILDDVYRRFREQYGNSTNRRVIFVTSLREVPDPRRRAFQTAWQEDEDLELECVARRSTPEALHSLFIEQKRQESLPDNFRHVVDLSCRVGKWSQLTAGLERLDGEIQPEDFIVVYDADSRCDAAALDFIAETGARFDVYQQVPLYEPAFPPRDFWQTLAHSRVLLNLHYALERELPAYYRSFASSSERVAVGSICHLLGHGYFIRKRLLDVAGGFRPPSCDSTLGYAVGLLGNSICPIPVADRADTPNTPEAIFWQGTVWFNGVSFLWREVRRFGARAPLAACAAILSRIRDNLRWGLYPVVMAVALIIASAYDPFMGLLGIVATAIGFMVRDLVGWLHYRQLFSMSDHAERTLVPFCYWSALSLLFAFGMRIFWALPPWYVVVCRMFGREPQLRKTQRS